MRIIKKIIFGITSLTLGGAERVLVDISNALANNYDITIFSIYDNGELKQELNKNVKFKTMYKCRYDDLNKVQKMWIPIKVFLFKSLIYKKYIKGDYDCEVAFLEGPVTRIFSTKNNNSKKVAWIHSDINQIFGNGIRAKLKKSTDKKIYSKFNNIVFVSNDNLENFKEIYNDINSEKLQVIYNYIDSDLVVKKSEEISTDLNAIMDSNTKNFVTVCRLVEPKAINRLIKVHSELINKGYYHKIYVIGDGPEKEHLQDLIKKYKVEESFKLLGKRNNPYPYIKAADYFCLLSYFEGFPMVIEEAKVLNKKIIITDTAARECLEGYENGIIVDNTDEGIYGGIQKILTEDNKEKYNLYYNYDNKDKLQRIIDLLEE